MRVLQITAHFSPNVGGVETHLSDLVDELSKNSIKVSVLTYQPLMVSAPWTFYETNNSSEIFRLPWIKGLFYKLVNKPLLEFLYLLPGLFLACPLIIILRRPDVVHAHGLVAGFVAVAWGKLFGCRVVVSVHSIYHFPEEGYYSSFVRWIFKQADVCLSLSQQSKREIVRLGTPPKKVTVFTYWVDLERFKELKNSELTTDWPSKFNVLFVGRLIQEKGVLELLESAKSWDKKIGLYFIGTGPLSTEIKRVSKKYKNINLLGKVDQPNLPNYYNSASVLVVPSTHEEGFGRVIIESLACGTPVIGSKRGAIPEAMDETVGTLIDVSGENIKRAVEFYYTHPRDLKRVSLHARKYALKRYSSRNCKDIIKTYQL